MSTFLLPLEPIEPLDAYLATDVGGSGVRRAHELGPTATIDIVSRSGLRGRGGGGFGLVSEATAPRVGRGRPRLCYTVDPSTESRWGVTGPYERLTLLLSEIIRTGDAPVDVGRRASRQAHAATSDAADPVAGLVGVMKRQGFKPTATRRGDRVDIVSGACPFETTALADSDTVCGLHLGLALGAADALDGLVIDELIPREPRRGACRLRCHVES